MLCFGKQATIWVKSHAIVPRVVEIDGTEIDTQIGLALERHPRGRSTQLIVHCQRVEHAISMTVPGADAPGAAEREVLLVLAAEEGDDLIDLLGREATHERHPTLASHEDVAAIEARSRSTPRTPHRRSPSARAPRGRGRRG